MKSVIKFIIAVLPSFFSTFVFSVLEIRRKNRAGKLKNSYQVSQSELDDLLSKLNVDSDILIHSSISSIGKFNSGISSVVDTLVDSVLGGGNTIIAPALPFNGYLIDHLCGLDYFDLTDAKNCMGAISNILMSKDECKRSLHPSHSVVAYGSAANEYIDMHHLCRTPFGEVSPYHQLMLNKGKVLMLGVDLNSVTNFHVYEDMLEEFFPLKVYTEKTYKIPCEGSGFKCVVETRAHNPQLSAKRDCERARTRLINNGFIQTYSLGASEVSLLDARGLTKTLFEMLLDNESIYGPIELSSLQKERVSMLLIELEC
jgi:aminoglycoside 3-N-acetyltransferase